MVRPAAKREAVTHLRNVLQMSERRACTIVAADRKMIRYRSRRPPDIELRSRLRDLANQRRRFGYRRLFILLREQGEPSGVNRIYRLYREEGLTVRKRKARRGLSELARRSWSRPGSTPAGRSISFMTSSPKAGASASSTSWMTSRESAWRRSLTLRSQASELLAN